MGFPEARRTDDTRHATSATRPLKGVGSGVVCRLSPDRPSGFDAVGRGVAGLGDGVARTGRMSGVLVAAHHVAVAHAADVMAVGRPLVVGGRADRRERAPHAHGVAGAGLRGHGRGRVAHACLRRGSGVSNVRSTLRTRAALGLVREGASESAHTSACGFAHTSEEFVALRWTEALWHRVTSTRREAGCAIRPHHAPLPAFGAPVTNPQHVNVCSIPTVPLRGKENA